MASDSTPWPYAGPPPPSGFNDAFLAWLKAVGDQLSIRLVEWIPVGHSDLEYLRQDHGGPEPAHVDFFYKHCSPCEYGVVLRSRYADARGSGAAPFWPLGFGESGEYVAFREDQTTGLSVTWIDSQGLEISRARGLREYFLMTVAAEHEWEPRAASTKYAEILNLPSVQQFSRALDADIMIHQGKNIASAILARTISPIEGAKKIWDLTLEYNEHPPLPLHTFIYAASEWESRPGDRAIFERGILEAARELVSTP